MSCERAVGNIQENLRERRPLAGRAVAIPETRELDRLRELLVEQGATPVSCPLIGIRDAADPGPIDAWLRRLCAGDFQDVIFMTGEGVTRLIGFAERAGMRREALAAISCVRTITRGPKPARALHQLGLRTTLPALQPTTDGIIETLAREPLGGRAIGLQLYGQDPNQRLVEFLEHRGAAVSSVAPYVYVPASDDVEVADLIGRLAEGAIDAIAFTTRTQVERLFEVATSRGTTDELRGGLRRTLVAAVGPLVVASLQERGILADTVPDRSFFLRPLVDQLAEAFSPRSLATSIRE
jgi:uroporphyrinogen-III synthase